MQPNLNMVIDQVSKDKGIDREVLIETLKQAIVTAAKKTFGLQYELEPEYNEDNGCVDLYQIVNVVDTIIQPGREISVDDARRHDPEAQIGDELLFQVFYRPEDADKAAEQDTDFGDLLGLKTARRGFGRIAAQTAKQVIIQRVREAERENIYNEYKDRKGELINGIVRRFERGNLIIDLGRAEAILPVREQVSRESYRVGDRVVAYVVDIDRSARGPQIILSRTHRGLLIKLFENEVPEIYEGIVRIESAAREPGARAKIAVSSRDSDVDPVGACVGMKGSRVQAVVQELRGEKIDIVPYDEDPARFVCNAIAPAEVSRVLIDAENHTMELIVPDDKLSLAIGKKGQNVRLASQLTGWRIDIHSETKVRELEEAAKRSLAEIEGVSEELADTMFKLGWRSPSEVAQTPPEELVAIPGMGGLEVAMSVVGNAEAAMVVQAERAERERERLLAEGQKSDEERWLSVKGMTDEIAAHLQNRYATIEQLAKEHDMLRMAEVGELGLSKAKWLHWSARVYLGELDAASPAPIVDEDEPIVRPAVREEGIA
ncbi:MAG: antitermination protein NusA [Proteobacteria bacterium]|nr:MAG: antitermination protein NusA [Pseudomonadota bacterium]PIE18887.1 MAG: antitermination protein NusA [Pseudomonadota bacterium]